MNAKVGVLVGVLILIILTTGGFMFFQNMSKPMPGSSSNSPGSIKDTLMAAGNMECNYTDEDGRQTTAYIKNGKVRANITSSNQNENGSVIFVDNTIYIWNSQGAFKMQIPEQTLNQDLSQNPALNQKEDLINSIEKYKQFCKSTNPNDSLFTLPSNLDFKDFSQMMKGFPTGTSGSDNSQVPSQEQVEQMMQ